MAKDHGKESDQSGPIGNTDPNKRGRNKNEPTSDPGKHRKDGDKK